MDTTLRDESASHLVEEEGISSGPILERGQQVGGRRDAEPPREELRRLLRSQPQQGNPVTPPDEPPEEVGDQCVRIPLRLTEGADDEHGDGLEVLGDEVE